MAVVESELAEITRDLFIQVAAEDPTLRERVHGLSRGVSRRVEAASGMPGWLLETLYDLLAQVPLFADLSPAALSEVAQSVQVRQYAAQACPWSRRGRLASPFSWCCQARLEVEVASSATP